MAFTYATLVQAIEGYTENSNWGTTTQIDAIIQQAEDRINTFVQVSNFNTKTYSNVDSGASIAQGDSGVVIPISGYGVVASATEAPLSPLYFKVRPATIKDCVTNASTTVTMASTVGIDVGASVDGDDVATGTTVSSVSDGTTILLSEVATGTSASVNLNFSESANVWEFLLLKDYNFLQEYEPTDNGQSTPRYYSFYNDTSIAQTPSTPGTGNSSTFSFSPSADTSYGFEILYLFQPTSIVTLTDGTWLSTHGSSALLYACLVEAYIFMKGEAELIQLYDSKYKEALQALVFIQGGSFRNSTYRDRALPGAV